MSNKNNTALIIVISLIVLLALGGFGMMFEFEVTE